MTDRQFNNRFNLVCVILAIITIAYLWIETKGATP